jgi:hypothetical protein
MATPENNQANSLDPSKYVTTNNGGTNINKKIELLDSKMDSLYKDIYISRPDNKNNLDDIINGLDNVIDNLQGSDSTVASMSELLRRITDKGKSNTDRMINSVRDLFEDQTLVGSLVMSTDMHNYIAGENYNYDLICKYLPRLQDALEIKRDNVLCSDNFSKNFLNPKSNKSSKEQISRFAINVDKIEEEYDISEFLDKTYMNTSKYGEDFIYIVPYNVAFTRLFKRTNNRINAGSIGQASLFESYTGGEEVCVHKDFQKDKEFLEFVEANTLEKESFANISFPELKIHFNNSNMIDHIVGETAILKDIESANKSKSLFSVFESSINEKAEDYSKLDSMFQGLGRNDRKAKERYLNNDGLILNTDIARDPDKLDKDFLGAVVERLPRDDVLPLYVGKKCLGYYYLEFEQDPTRCGFCGGHHSTPLLGLGNRMAYDMSERQEELAIRYISARISSCIDTKFINTNKDLKEEIYSLLYYNEKFDITRTSNIGITFIPAEDIVHCYFEKDEHTNRGISDLRRSVIPAMLYILLYLTDIISKITRSTDKRVYYVKQNVETNVARTMMNVVQQIKKGNLGMRQIESMNNILNIVGKYNDLIIPMGPQGDPPVQFEVMQGQTIETPTDIMEKMEEAAVNPIMPFELVNATYQQDFATRYSMSNTRLLKTIYTRQRKTEKIFSKIYTKIYNYEFGEHNKYIEVILPPPTYLVSTNNTQLIDNVSQMADKIIDTELDGESDEVKQEFKKIYVRDSLAAYIDYDKIERLKQNAKVNIEIGKTASAEDGEMSEVMDDEY